MNTKQPNSTRVIYIANELLNESAGTPRQERWLAQYLARASSVLVLVAISSRKVICETFTSFDQAEAFRSDRAGKKKATAGTPPIFLRALFRFLKQTLMLEFVFPSQLKIAYHLLQCIRWERKTTKIVIHASSPPFPAAFWAALIKSCYHKRDISLHVDMRDPWATHETLSQYRYLRRKIEGFVLRRANLVTAVSEYTSLEFLENYGVHCKTVLNVPDLTSNRQDYGGISDSSPEISKRTIGDKLTVAYVGSLPDDFYDLDTMAQLLEQLYQVEPRLKLRFVGGCEEMKACMSRNKLKVLEVSEFVGVVPRNTAIDFMKKADVLLFFGHRFPGYLTTKLFEYLLLRKPILSLMVREDYDAANLLKQLCPWYVPILDAADLGITLQNSLWVESLPRLIQLDDLNRIRPDYDSLLTPLFRADVEKI